MYSMISRKIIHCDCDSFFASVEMRDDPSLRSLPIAVGGASDRRGVIATCNYLAREYGVRSAMPTAHARRLCPDLVLLPPRFDAYREASKQIRRIFFDYTDLVQPLSLDEAFLDVSDSDHCRGSATLIAEEIRQRISDEVGVTASAGIAPNKFLAKIASDLNKPNGQFVIRPQQVEEFVISLPVSKIFGVGKVTADRMQRMGIKTCADLRHYSLASLIHEFGKFGHRLYELCRGIDHRPVSVDDQRKSVSVEQTYPADLPSLDDCLHHLDELLVDLRARVLNLSSRYLPVRVFVKLKFDDFEITTLERALNQLLTRQLLEPLLTEAWQRRQRPVRLLGIGVKLFDQQAPGVMEQLPLFEVGGTPPSRPQ